MKGNTTWIVVENGVKVKKITTNPMLFLMYCKILLLLDPEKAKILVSKYGKFFHDQDIVEANALVLK